MFAYEFGGFVLSSEITLTGLRPAVLPWADAASDLHLTFAHQSGPQPDRLLFRWPGRYGLTLGQCGEEWLVQARFGAAFLFSKDGRNIRAFSDSSSLSLGFMDVLARRILPRLAILLGALPIHAGAVANAMGALLIMGPSGAGKSTLTAAAARQLGYDVLSDDIAILRNGEPATVAPAASGICLWSDSRHALSLQEGVCRVMPGYEGKLWYGPQDGDATNARPLRATVSLSRSEDVATPRLQRLPQTEGFVLAANQLIHFNPEASANGEAAPLMERLSRMLRGVPAYQLTYPAQFASLSQTVQKLSELLPT